MKSLKQKYPELDNIALCKNLARPWDNAKGKLLLNTWTSVRDQIGSVKKLREAQKKPGESEMWDREGLEKEIQGGGGKGAGLAKFKRRVLGGGGIGGNRSGKDSGSSGARGGNSKKKGGGSGSPKGQAKKISAAKLAKRSSSFITLDSEILSFLERADGENEGEETKDGDESETKGKTTTKDDGEGEDDDDDSEPAEAMQFNSCADALIWMTQTFSCAPKFWEK